MRGSNWGSLSPRTRARHNHGGASFARLRASQGPCWGSYSPAGPSNGSDSDSRGPQSLRSSTDAALSPNIGGRTSHFPHSNNGIADVLGRSSCCSTHIRHWAYERVWNPECYVESVSTKWWVPHSFGSCVSALLCHPTPNGYSSWRPR